MIPLAEKLRPKVLSDISGHEKLLCDGSWLKNVIASKHPRSILLWGPPGCGKTTLARIYANSFDASFLAFSGVSGKLSEIKKTLEDLQAKPLFHRQTILFIDEIHRLNKSQQDFFLPLIENGSLVLIGATTENPSFALQPALLSRLRVLTLGHLEKDDLEKILNRFEKEQSCLPLTEEARSYLLKISNGDGRYLLNLVESLLDLPKDKAHDIEEVAPLLQKRPALYDKDEEWHYNIISALHKAVRGSDADGALYWLCRMLQGGEDPRFIGRRLIRMAVEDIGLADPEALTHATHACEAYERLGSPEGELALAQATLYLSLAPKSNAVYTAFQKALETAENTSHLPPPKNFLNAPTSFMKTLGYGKEYEYDHDHPHGCAGQNFFPDDIPFQEFYHPVERGFERELRKRKTFFLSLRIPTANS